MGYKAFRGGWLGILLLGLILTACTRERPPVQVTPWTPPTTVVRTPTRSREAITPTPTVTVTPTPQTAAPTEAAPPLPTVPATATPTPAATSEAESPAWHYYTVQRGDTLFSIAARFNTTVAELKRLNGLTDDTIYVGQKLKVPGPPPSEATEPRVYVVQPGDTLFSIARRFGVDMQELARLNNITDPSTIYVGQRLILPQGAVPAQQLYQVQPGDTLSAIAQRFGVSLQALMEANGITNPDEIYVGQILRIP